MAKLTYFLWLVQQAAVGWIWVWPVTLVLVLGLSAGVAVGRPKSDQHRLVLAHLSVLIIPLITFALGAWFTCTTCPPGPVSQDQRPSAVIALIGVLWPVQLAIATGLVWVSRGWRLLALFTQAAILWWSFMAGFMAEMSLTGDWL